MRRGDVWWANLPAGRRPVVLVSRGDAYAVRHNITVAEVSTVIRAIASEVGLGRSDGMPKTCVINTDNLVTIPKRWLDQRITTLNDDRIVELDAALAFSLELE